MSISVNLKHRLGDFQLDASFEAPDGLTVLFGRSGSGKTSIIKSVSGLIHPNEGHVSSGEMTLLDTQRGIFLPPHKRRIGYIFQEDRLFPHLTVAQNLDYGTRFAPNKTGGSDRQGIIDMLAIGSLLTRKPTHLSGGEKQRVAIGRALLSHPQLILADEPLAALDDERKEEILPYFERLRDHVNVPVLYVTHSAAEVSRLATTVVALANGQVTKQGPAIDVLSDPQVTPLGPSAAGAFLTAKIVRHHSDGITEVDARGTTLLLPNAPHPVGSDLRVRVEAQDVMISLDAPTGISALNILPATVSELRKGDGPGALVQLKLGSNTLLARVTQRSANALSLQPGKNVYAIVKAVSIPRGAIGDRQESTIAD